MGAVLLLQAPLFRIKVAVAADAPPAQDQSQPPAKAPAAAPAPAKTDAAAPAAKTATGTPAATPAAAKPAPKKPAVKKAPPKPVAKAAAAPAKAPVKKPNLPALDPGAARPLMTSKAPPEPPMLTAHDKQVFADAMRAAEKHQWPNAIASVSQTHNPLLRKIIDWGFLHDPGPHANFSQRTAFIAANPDWPAITDLRRYAEDSIDSTVPTSALLTWFDAHPPLQTSGKSAYARALQTAGRTAEAHKVARDAWLSGYFDKNGEDDFLAAFGDILTPEDHWARVDRILYDEQTGAAQRLLPRISDDQARVARARIAMITNAGNSDSLQRDVPAPFQSDPGLLYDRLKWRHAHDKSDAVFDFIPQFAVPGPRPDLWWRERSDLVRDALMRGRITEAYTIAKNHGSTDASVVSDAEFLAGWIALRFLKDGETALPHFEKVYDISQTPPYLARGAYWTGRAAESLGRPDIATQWYQRAATYLTTYYGQLALGRIGANTVPQLEADPTPTVEERTAFENKETTRALRAILEVDAKAYERPFAVALAESSGFAVDRQMVAELLNRHARPDLGIMIARNAARDKISLIEYGYPVPPYSYPEAPEKALILSIARQESNFDPGAVSYAGARGLMQLMPDTASGLARAAKIAYTRAKLVTDPVYNLKLGAGYLASLVNSFDGSYMLAAAAYNAGPGRTRQWVKQFGDPQDPHVDPVDWVEQIPFNETRGYVQRVMESVMIYRAVLAGTAKVGPTLEVELAHRPRPLSQ